MSLGLYDIDQNWIGQVASTGGWHDVCNVASGDGSELGKFIDQGYTDDAAMLRRDIIEFLHAHPGLDTEVSHTLDNLEELLAHVEGLAILADNVIVEGDDEIGKTHEGAIRAWDERGRGREEIAPEGAEGLGSSTEMQDYLRTLTSDLKKKWGALNTAILNTHNLNADAPEVRALIEQQNEVNKQAHELHELAGSLVGDEKEPATVRSLVVVGAGPGGLTAAIAGATEGHDTVLIDGNLQAGGQAKYSSRIENYTGFPAGITGTELAARSLDQAQRVGAELKLGSPVSKLEYDPETQIKTLTLANGEQIQARAVVLATGIEFHKMDFPGSDSPDVIYANSEAIEKMAQGGKPVAIIGGSNGAAQAALAAARESDKVTLMSRSPIEKSMSDYQINQVTQNKNLNVMEGEEIARLLTDDSGHAYGVETKSGKTIAANALGIFIGGSPKLDWLPEQVKRDKSNKIEVDPWTLETGMPGVYAVGDGRVHAGGRVATAVGDAHFAVRSTWERLSPYVQRTTSKAVGDADWNREEWNRLEDAFLALDLANPYLSTMAEPEAEVSASKGFEVELQKALTELLARPVLAIDLDGTLAGPADLPAVGVPLPGAIEALRELSRNFEIVIFTAREDFAPVWEWLRQYGASAVVSSITNIKPQNATEFVDDRGTRFMGEWTPEFIAAVRNFTPYWKATRGTRTLHVGRYWWMIKRHDGPACVWKTVAGEARCVTHGYAETCYAKAAPARTLTIDPAYSTPALDQARRDLAEVLQRVFRRQRDQAKEKAGRLLKIYHEVRRAWVEAGLLKIYNSNAEIPDYLHSLPARQQRQWRHVWNSSYARARKPKDQGGLGLGAEEAESFAFRNANGVAGPNTKAIRHPDFLKAEEEDDEDAVNMADEIYKALREAFGSVPVEGFAPLERAAMAGVEKGVRDVEVRDDGMIDSLNAGARDWAAQRAAEMVGMRKLDDGTLIENPNARWRIDDTTRNDLRRILTQGFRQETPMPGLIDQIGKAGAFSDSRAETIARTEVAFAQAHSAYDVWEETGVVKSVRWDLSVDHVPGCDCDLNAGVVVPIGEPFPSGDDMPPAHPRCICTAVAAELA